MRCLISAILIVLLACNNVLAGFNGYLKADTQVIAIIGPFVDVSDGFTPQTDIGNPDTNLTGVDEAELLKHGSVTTVDITARTWAAVASVDGYYGLTLTTTDTNTEGLLTVIIQDDSDCLPVRCTFMVMNDNSFEAFFENAAEILTVNTTQVNGTSQTANDMSGDIDTIATAVGNIETDTAAYDTDGEYATAIWNALTNAYGGAGTYGQVAEDILVDTSTTLDDLIDTEIGTIVTAVGNIETDTAAQDTAGEWDTLMATVDGKLDTAQADLDTITGASGVLIDTDAVDADALKTDAVTEFWSIAMTDMAAGNPSVTAAANTALNWLYTAWRNGYKTDGTNSEIVLYKDDGTTPLVEADIADDGTDFTRQEYGAPD
jgi:hypothetical protein